MSDYPKRKIKKLLDRIDDKLKESEERDPIKDIEKWKKACLEGK